MMATCTMASIGMRAPVVRLDASKPRHRSVVPVPAQRRAGLRTRDVRRSAWLGEWMKDNFGGDEKKEGEAWNKNAKKGLDPDLFKGAERVAAVPTGDRAGAGGRNSSSASRRKRLLDNVPKRLRRELDAKRARGKPTLNPNPRKRSTS